MTHTEEARIYLADQRHCSQTPDHRSFQTFQDEPSGNLKALNDDTLRAGVSRSWQSGGAMLVTVLPLVGNVQCTVPSEPEQLVEAGQVYTFHVPRDSEFLFRNPYEHQLINFLHCWTFLPPEIAETRPRLSCVDLDYNNVLVPAVITPAGTFLIGKFEGRIDSNYRIQNSGAGIFVCSLEGAFEVQGRLLDSRDGLSLRHCSSVDFEALSPEGILLIYEEAP